MFKFGALDEIHVNIIIFPDTHKESYCNCHITLLNIITINHMKENKV